MTQDAWTELDRQALCRETGGFFVVIGYEWRRSPDGAEVHRIAIGVLLQIAGDLVDGALSCIESRNLYACAALSRQILEITDLLKYFADRPDRAAFWLTASDDDLKKARDFGPAQLRRVAGTPGTAYGHHCMLGGHPRRLGALLLPGSSWRREGAAPEIPGPTGSVRLDLGSALIVDLLQHSYDLLTAYVQAAAPDDVLFTKYEKQGSQLVQRLGRWRNEDPFVAAVESYVPSE